ncbi:MAG: RDD family protein [bacterium]|nr:RDD family protein [Candidatus Sumerlaeota bacterium]
MKDTLWRADALSSVLDMDQGPNIATHEVAGPGSRFVAALIDMTIAATWAAGLWLIMLRMAPTVAPVWKMAAVVVTALGLHIVLSLIFELAARGQTIGKNICGLRAVSRSGCLASPAMIIVRNLMRAVDWLPIQYATGAVSAMSSPWSMRLGDRLAGTVVINELSLKELLEKAQAPSRTYSTSPDAYLLEAFVMREVNMPKTMRDGMAAALAAYFNEHYPSDDPAAEDAYKRGDHIEYLHALFIAESETHSG